ncbi:hypothetical protein ACVU7I_09965 [Patulibacter sp. S7RM1-6]
MSRIRALITGLPAGRLMTVLAAAIVAVAVAAPLAVGAGEGSDVVGGKRNPTGGSTREFASETEIIARNSTFGTRQSNKGAGGGAIYGCRAANAGKACIEASNLSNGQAFGFRFRGPVGGTITTNATGPAAAEAKPFTTNATGVATGLNADRVDGKDAQQIVDEAAARTKIATLTAQGELQNQRGFTAAGREAEGRYLLTTDGDISKCVPSVTAYGTAENPNSNATVEIVDGTHVRVFTQSGGDTPAAADRQVAVTVNC